MKDLNNMINWLEQLPTDELKAIFYFAGRELKFRKYGHRMDSIEIHRLIELASKVLITEEEE